MGTINIYKGISEEYTTIKGNGKIKDLIQTSIQDFNLDNAVYINAGDNVTSDYLVKDDDVIFVRVIPGATAAIVIASIACVASAVALGAAIYSAVETAKMQDQAEKAQRAAKAMSEKIKQLPFIKGANNRSALGYNIPYAMGSVYNVPYKLSNGFYSISGQNGKNQFWNCNFISAYNNAIIQDVSIGSIKILKPNSTIDIPNKDSVPYLKDSGVNPYFFEKDCDYYDPASAVEIKYKDEMSLDGINEKVTASSYQDSLDPQEPITKQLEENTYKVDVCIKFDGLRKYSDGWTSKAVNFKIECSNDGGKSWSDKGKLSTGEINSNRTVRFQKTINFTASECVGKSITLRITRTTLKEESNSQESAYLNYINCWQYDNTTSTSSQIVVCRPLEMPWRERTTRIGLRVIANDSTKDSLNEINCNVYGKARIWNGTNWTKETYPTRNPASWVLAVMTTEIHPHSRYADEEIDLQSLGKLYEKCEQEKFYCDGLITEESKKSEILNNILNECNATMYMDHATGKWTFAIEEKQNVPIALLNSQCIKNVTVTKSFERKPFAVKNTFTNRNSWMVDTFYQTANGIISSKEAYRSKKIIIENAPKFVTTYDHLYKLTRRQLAKQNLQPREITVAVGREGDYYPLYSKVLLQMKPLKIGLSEGVIHSVVMEGNLLTTVVTSDLCDFTDTSKRYGLIIQAQSDSGRKHIYVEVTGNGKTKTVRLKTPTACSIVPEYGNSYSFGLLDKNGSFNTVTNPMMIYGTKQTVDGWELTLKDYNDAIFEDGVIPEYKTNVTNHRETGLKLPSVTYEELMDLVESNNIPGKDAISVHQEKNSYVYNADEDGAIKESTLSNIVHVMLGDKELPFRFGRIDVPEGFYITTDYHTVNIRAEKGKSMADEGTIKIPVLYHSIKEEIQIGFDNTVISNGANSIGYHVFNEKETAYILYFSYAKASKGLQGEATWTATFDKGSYCYAVDNEGKAFGESVPATIRLLKGEKEVPFTIEKIDNIKNEVSTKIDGNTICFESMNGNKISDSVSIPITIKHQDSEMVGIGIGAASFGADGIGIGYRKFLGEAKVFTLYWNYSTVRAGVNRGVKSEIDSYLQASGKRYKGDFFTWGGKPTTVVYDGVSYTFVKGRVYGWNGNTWKPSTDNNQLSLSFDSVMSILDDEVANNNAMVNVFATQLATLNAFVKNLFAQNITMQPGGLFKSQQWDGSIESGVINTYGSKGWALDYAGNIDSVNMHAKNAYLQDCVLGGYLWGNNTPFKPCASFNIGYKDGSLKLYNGKNIGSIEREGQGVYIVYFKTPIKLRTHAWEGHNYIDLFVTGNCHSTFASGFTDPLIPEINWVRNWVDDRLTVSNGFATVTYAKIYFCDNNQDACIDPNAAQCFVFGTETD